MLILRYIILNIKEKHVAFISCYINFNTSWQLQIFATALTKQIDSFL